MRRSTLFFTVLVLFAILLSACGKPESESSSLPDFSESVSEQSSPKEAPQENSETVLLGSIAEINLSDIYSVKISCRNIEGIKSCRLTGSAADEYAKALSEIRLVPFDKMKFDAITGGDIVYSVYFRGGEAEIVYNGSYTITADLFEKEDIDGERFLPADKGYPEIPGDVFWCTLKKIEFGFSSTIFIRLCMSETFFSLMLVQSLEYISSSLSLVMSVSKPKNEKIFSVQPDMARLISFSTIPVAESAPPSSPPWPGSITTVRRPSCTPTVCAV